MLLTEFWSDLYSKNDVNEAFDYFLEVFMFYFNVNFPKRLHYPKKEKHWVDQNVIKSSTKLKDLFILKNEYNQLNEIYKVEKRRHEKLIQETKKRFYQDRINNSSNIMKTSWRVISELTDNKKHSSKNISLKQNGTVIEEPQQIAQTFNLFFKNAPNRVLNEIQNSSKINFDEDNSQHIGFHKNSFFLEYVSENELYNIIYIKLKNKLSSGHDDVPSFLVKRIGYLLTKPLTFIILSFASGVYPKALKLGKVLPLLKQSNKPHDIDNFRPVTVPTTFSKIFEYALLYRLTPFLKKNETISKNQHGFVQDKSIISAIQSFHSEIIDLIDSGECPIGIFCDLSRAFDCVNHSMLLDKLYKYGIRGLPYEWLSSYLSERKQYVTLTHYGNTISEVCSGIVDVEHGVPQGSILGPVLFLLYVNDIGAYLPDIHITSYADDTSVIISPNPELNRETEVENALVKLNQWFNKNYLHLNCSKTHIMQFHSKQKKIENINVYLNNNRIDNANEVKFLGVLINDCLSWTSHCQMLISKLNTTVYKIR